MAGPGSVLEQERRRVVEAADPERALDQPHGAVGAREAQLPSPMWLIRIESRGKSIAYISVNCVVAEQFVAGGDISAAVSASPSARKPKPAAIRLEAAASGSRAKRPSSAIASKWVE